MKLLIGKADFEGRIDLSTNLDAAKKLNQHITHAQDFDLRELMTDQFYYYFMSFFTAAGIDPEAPEAIKDLYNGKDYQISGVSWSNPGIKPVLVYFTGARLIRGIDNHITPNGFRTKVNEFSEPVSNGTKVFQANEYENQALSYWAMITTYLNHNKDLYPHYFSECGCPATRGRKRPRTIAVGNI